MIDRNEINANAKGGTELSIAELESVLKPELLAKVQIIPSRFRGLKEGLIPIYWVHDTENDPEMAHLADSGWQKFAKIVFVSNWQMQRFIEKFNIPWSKCFVLPNAVRPFGKPKDLDWSGELRFIYHTTPHRGLNILYAAFDAFSRRYNNVRLDVYSSFSMYGWSERDEPYKPLFKAIDEHPAMTFHGAVPNEIVREELTNTHAFFYPCTWPETGCRALMEAMMAGAVCAHTNFGCLYETGAGLTKIIQHDTDNAALAEKFYVDMVGFKQSVEGNGDLVNHARRNSAQAANAMYSWDLRGREWNNFLEGVIHDHEQRKR